MQQSPQREIKDIIVATEETTRSFKQEFQFYPYTVTHEHRIKVEVNQPDATQFSIFNHFARIEGDYVVKLTEIRLNGRIVTIMDLFSSQLTPCNTSSLSSSVPGQLDSRQLRLQPRRQILSKKFIPHTDSTCLEPPLRDTKNLVKNIMRLFQTWLEDHKAPNEDINMLSEAMRIGKFNNNLVISISKHQTLRRHFLRFCDQCAEDYIARSKIHDKSSHLQALKKYHNICADEEDIQKEEGAEHKEQVLVEQ